MIRATGDGAELTAASSLSSSGSFGDKYHVSPRPVSPHHAQLQTIDVNLIATFTRPLFTMTSISLNRLVHRTLNTLSPMILDGRPRLLMLNLKLL